MSNDAVADILVDDFPGLKQYVTTLHNTLRPAEQCNVQSLRKIMRNADV